MEATHVDTSLFSTQQVHQRALLSFMGIDLYVRKSTPCHPIGKVRLFNAPNDQPITPPTKPSDKAPLNEKTTSSSELAAPQPSTSTAQPPITESKVVTPVSTRTELNAEKPTTPPPTPSAIETPIIPFGLALYQFEQGILLTDLSAVLHPEFKPIWQKLGNAVSATNKAVFRWPLLPDTPIHEPELLQSALKGFYHRFHHLPAIALGPIPHSHLVAPTHCVYSFSLAELYANPAHKRTLWAQIQALKTHNNHT